MRRSAIVAMFFVFIALVPVIAGCGSAGSLDIADPYTGPVTSVVFTSDALSDGDMQDSGVEKTIDSSATTCDFSFDPLSETTGISVVPDPAGCADKNRCIVCTPVVSGPHCSISCAGTVPSTGATADDLFDIYVTYHPVITTQLTSPKGMIRMDGSTTNWAEFDLTQTPVWDLSDCVAPHMKVTTVDPGKFDTSTATTFTKGLTLSAINDATCSYTVKYRARMPLTGVATPDTTINLTRGNISIKFKICDKKTKSTCTSA